MEIVGANVDFDAILAGGCLVRSLSAFLVNKTMLTVYSLRMRNLSLHARPAAMLLLGRVPRQISAPSSRVGGLSTTRTVPAPCVSIWVLAVTDIKPGELLTQ